MIKAQYLEVDLYEGNVISNIQVDVDLSQPIVHQVVKEVVKKYDKKDQQEIYSSMVNDFKSTSTGYKIHGEEVLYLIILPKPE